MGKPVSKKILKNFFWPSGPQFGLKIRGRGGGGLPPWPLPWIRHCKHVYDYNTSVSKLKKFLSLELLNKRRKSHHLQIFHKSVYNDIALPIRETRNYLMNSFIHPSVHHDYYKYSFFPRTIRDWNCLLPETRVCNIIIQHFAEQHYFKFCFKYSNFLIIYLIFNFYLYFYFLTLLDV